MGAEVKEYAWTNMEDLATPRASTTAGLTGMRDLQPLGGRDRSRRGKKGLLLVVGGGERRENKKGEKKLQDENIRLLPVQHKKEQTPVLL